LVPGAAKELISVEGRSEDFLSQAVCRLSGMDWGKLTEDQLDELIVRAEGEIASWRAVQMAAVGEKRSRGSHRADGHRSIVEWLAARADVSQETARRICWTGSRMTEAPETAEQLAAGEISFDRAEQLARLPAEQREGHEGYGIAQLRRLVAHHRRLTRRRERRITNNGYLNFATSPDEVSTSLWGELAGLDARIVEKAVDQRADELIPADTRLAVAERRALALVAMCQDSLYDPETSDEGSPLEVAVTVDARTAAAGNGETGVSVLAGPPARARDSRRDPVQWDRRSRWCGRRRRAAQPGTPLSNCSSPTSQIRPLSGRGMHRWRLHQPISARSAPLPTLVIRRGDQRRRPDHVVLVSPSHRRPPRRARHPEDRILSGQIETT
jgi:hypothetical protein